MTQDSPQRSDMDRPPKLAATADTPVTETARPNSQTEDVEDELPELGEDEAEQIIVLDENGTHFSTQNVKIVLTAD